MLLHVTYINEALFSALQTVTKLDDKILYARLNTQKVGNVQYFSTGNVNKLFEGSYETWFHPSIGGNFQGFP